MPLDQRQLRQALGETAEINKKGQDALLSKLDEIEAKKDLSKQTHLNERKTSQQAILSQIQGVQEAVQDKETPTDISINNPKAITEDIMAGLSIVVSTLKEELGKLDTETIINNDFSRLEELLTDKSDKEEVVQALEAVEDAINSIEKPQFTDYTQVLNSIKDKIQTPDNKDILEALEKIISKEFKLPDVVQVDLDPNLIEDDFIKMRQDPKQVDAMSKMMSVGGSGWQNIATALEKQTSELLENSTQMSTNNELLEQVLLELKIINVHQQSMTDEEVNEADVEKR